MLFEKRKSTKLNEENAGISRRGHFILRMPDRNSVTVYGYIQLHNIGDY